MSAIEELQFLRSSMITQAEILLNRFLELQKKCIANEKADSKIVSSFDQVQLLLSSFCFHVKRIEENWFDWLPDEIITLIFSFIPPRDLFGIELVCKRFHSLSNSEYNWKQACLQWWSQILPKEKPSILEDCIQWSNSFDNTKNWKWLTKCITARYKESRFSWEYDRYSQEKCSKLVIGSIQDRNLYGWGIIILFDNNGVEKCVGRFQKVLQQGIRQNQLGITYKGTFNKDGDYLNGFGSITWPNGFKHEGEWENGQPKDRENCLHPAIKNAVHLGKCTSEVTQDEEYGQFLDWGFCQSCFLCCGGITRHVPLFYSTYGCVCSSQHSCNARDRKKDTMIESYKY